MTSMSPTARWQVEVWLTLSHEPRHARPAGTTVRRAAMRPPGETSATPGARNGRTVTGRRSDHRPSGTHPTRPEEQPNGHDARSRSRLTMLRRPAVLLAIALDVAVVIVALVLLVNGGSLVILAIAAILVIAPWAAIIDDAEKPRRRD